MKPILRRAGKDQIAHLFRKGEPRTFCGLPVVAERLAWPHTIYCPDCETKAMEVATAERRTIAARPGTTR